MSTVTEKGKVQRKEELSKFLATHDDEKNEDLAGQVLLEKEKHENMTILQQIKYRRALRCKQAQDSAGRMSAIIETEHQRILLEKYLMLKRSEIMKMDKVIVTRGLNLQHLELIIERAVSCFEKFLERTEKKSMDTKKLFEEEGKAELERKAAFEKLADKITTINSKLTKTEDTLNKHKRYKNILFKLSPPEWQESQEAEALKAKDHQESALESSPGGVLPTTGGPTLSSALSGTLETKSKMDSSSESEEKLEIYFSDLQQLLDLVTQLTEQNLSLIQNSKRMDETLEEQQDSTEATLKRVKEDEEKLVLQVAEMKDRTDKEKKRAAELKTRVQLHVTLKSEDKDVLLHALDVAVTKVHQSCVDSRFTNLSTLEKLSSVEYSMSVLLQVIESIPEENLETLRQIKESERRNRVREEQLRLEREKHRERMKKCIQRSMGDPKKISGRRLIPRCIPVEQKIKAKDEDNIPAEDDLHAYLFTTEDKE